MIGSRLDLLPMRVKGVRIGYPPPFIMETAGTAPAVRLLYRPFPFFPAIFITEMERRLSLKARRFFKCITSFQRYSGLILFGLELAWFGFFTFDLSLSSGALFQARNNCVRKRKKAVLPETGERPDTGCCEPAPFLKKKPGFSRLLRLKNPD